METSHPEPERAANSIQVSLDKLPTFYARIGKRMLQGSAERQSCDEVVITGLGMATKTAIGAASIIERENAAKISRVETAYFSSTRAKRRIPKITITLVKNPDAPVPVEDTAVVKEE